MLKARGILIEVATTRSFAARWQKKFFHITETLQIFAHKSQ